VAEDFRLSVDFDDEGDGADLVEWLGAVRLARDERQRLGDRVVVSRDGARVFLYADTEEAVREAERVVRGELAHRDARARLALERWHPVEQVWKDAAEPLPRTEDEVDAERARQQAREAAHSRDTGFAEWEVRIELRSHEETEALAERLEGESMPVVRRATFLLVGAANEDEAVALAERLKAELPERARIEVEPGGGMVWEVMPQNPFAFFGGLGV
jgi:hypothetical protein